MTAAGTTGGETLRREVRLSRAAVDSLNDLPKSQARAVAKAIDYLSSGEETGQSFRLWLPGADGDYRAMRTAPDGPVIIYRLLSESEGGGYLVAALVASGDFKAYERADRKGLLDTTFGKVLLSAAAAGTVLGARGTSRN